MARISDRADYGRRRRAAAKAARSAARAAAFLVTQPEDVGYLSGFSGEDSYLLLGDGWACLLTDGRFAEQAQRECAGIQIRVRTGPMTRAIAEVMAGNRARTLAVQAEHVTMRVFAALEKMAGKGRVKPVEGVVGQLRIRKDAQEVASIRRAVAAAQRAFREMLAQGVKGWVGRTERALAAELEYRMRLAGASGPSFETIVAAGAHGSLPHYRPGDRRIRPDEAVLVDWGAMVEGYCSDLTRVVFTGRIPPKLADVYEVVRRSQQAGMSVIRAGVSGASVDQAARGVIEKAGYGERFVHSLGHGIGRQIHEAPTLARRQHERLKAGMVVTVEPGIYLPGVGGVRIEDDVLVTAEGGQRLSSLPTSLSAMVLR